MFEKLARCPICESPLEGEELRCRSCGATARVDLSYEKIMREIFLLTSPRI